MIRLATKAHFKLCPISLKIALLLISFQNMLIAQMQPKPLIINQLVIDSSIYSLTQILFDTTRQVTFDQILNPTYQNKFKKNTSNNFGFNSPCIWLKFSIQNLTDDKFFLVLDLGTLDDLQIFEVYPNGKFSVTKTGSIYPFAKRTIQVNGFIYELKIPQNQTYTYYLRLNSKRSLRLPLRIMSANKLLERRHKADFLQGLYLGVLALIIVFSIFLYFAVRTGAFFWYSFYTFTFTLVILNQVGYAEGFFWANFPQMNNYVGALVSTSNILHLLFFYNYLDTAKRIPRWHKLSYFAVLLPFGITFLLSIMGYVGESIQWVNNFTLSGIILCTLALWLVYRKGYFISNFFVVGIGFLWTFIAIHLMYIIGILPFNLITSNSIIFGGLGEAIFFSFALADQMNIVRRENEKVQAENIHLVKEQNQILETRILERTIELQALNEELLIQSDSLSQLNQAKNKLFSVISHDFRGPLNSMKGTLRLLKEGHLTEDELSFLASGLEEKVNVTSILLDNLLFWAKGQMDGLIIQPEDFDMVELVNEQFELFKFQAQDKQIQLIQNIPSPFMVFADPNCIRLVIRNLISNAIKFCQAGDTITISGEIDKNTAIIQIKDTGIGIESEKIHTMFDQPSSTIGTAQEKGTGLGLVLCKDFIQKNQGKIWIESELNQGSSFYFSLPIMH